MLGGVRRKPGLFDGLKCRSDDCRIVEGDGDDIATLAGPTQLTDWNFLPVVRDAECVDQPGIDGATVDAAKLVVQEVETFLDLLLNQSLICGFLSWLKPL